MHEWVTLTEIIKTYSSYSLNSSFPSQIIILSCELLKSCQTVREDRSGPFSCLTKISCVLRLLGKNITKTTKKSYFQVYPGRWLRFYVIENTELCNFKTVFEGGEERGELREVSVSIQLIYQIKRHSPRLSLLTFESAYYQIQISVIQL